MSRVLPNTPQGSPGSLKLVEFDKPRTVLQTSINFGSLDFPQPVASLLAEAFWSHIGIRPARSILTTWSYIRVFSRFVSETNTVKVLADLNGPMLMRYVGWLAKQRKADGTSWSKSSMSAAFSALTTLLKWIERCHPTVLPSMVYPFNPFPWRNRDTKSRDKLSAHEIRAILKACESDILRMRAEREAFHERRMEEKNCPRTLGWLLEYCERRYGGMPEAKELKGPDSAIARDTLASLGGLKNVEPFLYPRSESLLPYYLAIMIHAAGNPDAIAELRRDCLQPMPLLTDRQILVWDKPRASTIQRRTFNSQNHLEPPALIREILAWNERLLSQVSHRYRDRLFVYKGVRGVTVLTGSTSKPLLKKFCERHRLSWFSLSSIRPGVLSSFYRFSGDLPRVSAAANHANLSTTVRYVHTPEVREQDQMRIFELQGAFVGSIQKIADDIPDRATNTPAEQVPPGAIVTMFGFDCKDAYAGTAPGSHKGQMCTRFMGCFTCPNAIIRPTPSTLARLLQARDHLRSAADKMHPARWQAIYAPQLNILEDDILPKFSISELAAAESYRVHLAPLPDLR